MTKRSRFLALTAIGTTAALTTWSPARAAQFPYKLGSPNPVEDPPNIASIQMARAIKEETNGRLDIGGLFERGARLAELDAHPGTIGFPGDV